jgi:hypothetical protein
MKVQQQAQCSAIPHSHNTITLLPPPPQATCGNISIRPQTCPPGEIHTNEECYLWWLPVHKSWYIVPIHLCLLHQPAAQTNSSSSFGVCIQHSAWHLATWEEICCPHSIPVCCQIVLRQTQPIDWASQWTPVVQEMGCAHQAVGNGFLCQTEVVVAYILLPDCCSTASTIQMESVQ